MTTRTAEPTGPLLELLADRWWTFVARGFAALLFGAATMGMPELTLLVLVYLWGSFAVVNGVLAVVIAVRSGRAGGRWGWFIFEGVLGIIAGVVTFAWPGITAVVLLAMIAAWAVLTGVAQIAAAFRLRDVIEHEWLLGLSGVLSVVFGCAVALRPGAGALAVAWMIGLYAILFGAMFVGLGVRLRALRSARSREMPTIGAPTPA